MVKILKFLYLGASLLLRQKKAEVVVVLLLTFRFDPNQNDYISWCLDSYALFLEFQFILCMFLLVFCK
jgi:hypothetical protein